MRDWTWASGGRCGVRGCRDRGYNGSWSSPTEDRTLCWSHYKKELAQLAARDSAEVIAERKRIAQALEAWVVLWEKPNRIAGTSRTVPPDDQINVSWITSFAEQIKDGTIGAPHNPEPEPLFDA